MRHLRTCMHNRDKSLDFRCFAALTAVSRPYARALKTVRYAAV